MSEQSGFAIISGGIKKEQRPEDWYDQMLLGLDELLTGQDRFQVAVEEVLPEPALAAKYEEKYRQFARLYPALKESYSEIYGVLS